MEFRKKAAGDALRTIPSDEPRVVLAENKADEPGTPGDEARNFGEPVYPCCSDCYRYVVIAK